MFGVDDEAERSTGSDARAGRPRHHPDDAFAAIGLRLVMEDRERAWGNRERRIRVSPYVLLAACLLSGVGMVVLGLLLEH
jgi:hypothetical protein